MKFPNSFFDVPAELDENAYLVHVSNPYNRVSILLNGLQPSIGDSFRLHWEDNDYLEGRTLPNLIFARQRVHLNDVQYMFSYDDDVWLIDKTKIPGHSWFVDSGIFRNQGSSVVCFDGIPPEALILHHKGTGEDEGNPEGTIFRKFSVPLLQ